MYRIASLIRTTGENLANHSMGMGIDKGEEVSCIS